MLGDCEGCHTVRGGDELAGGLPLNTPFGVIYTANITPDRVAGIGGWTESDFYRAIHQGHGVKYAHLYPAFPYPYFTEDAARRRRCDLGLSAHGPCLADLAAAEQDRLPVHRPGADRAVWNWLNFRSR